MARPQKTQAIGRKTETLKVRHTRFNVNNKDDAFDYSFRRKADIETGGGSDEYGYEPVSAENSSGEEFSVPGAAMKTKGKGQLVIQDVILCRRPKEVSAEFKRMEDEKFNNQQNYIKNVAQRHRAKLREIVGENDIDFRVTDQMSTTSKQRKGPTEE